MTIARFFSESCFNIKMFFQRIFRKRHLSDIDLWGASHVMTKRIYPVIKAYYEMERHGYPSYFCDYEPHSAWSSEDEYNSQKAAGYYGGGGEKAWDDVIKKILKSLEYTLADYKGKEEDWFQKYYNETPHDQIEKNRYISYNYQIKGKLYTMSHEKPELKDGEEFEEYEEKVCYYNSDLMHLAMKDVSEGYELLGKFWQDFWD